MELRTVAAVVAGIAASVASTPGAHAGACLTAQEDEDDLKALEAYAAPKTKPHTGGGPWLCVDMSVGADALVDGNTGNEDKRLAEKLRKRAVAACTKVLERDGETAMPCVVVLAASGLAKVGSHDLVPLIDKMPEDPIDNAGGIAWTKTQLYGRMGDPRGAVAVVAMWKAALPRADAREKRHREMQSWSGWRQVAADVLGKVGTADDVAFLDEQAKATKDKHVAQACRDAEAAIAKRTGPGK